MILNMSDTEAALLIALSAFIIIYMKQERISLEILFGRSNCLSGSDVLKCNKMINYCGIFSIVNMLWCNSGYHTD